MSLFFVLYFKEIIRLGRRYPFPRPLNCIKEGCKSQRLLWGHGYIETYFEGYNTAITLRRYRCKDCGCVYTIRPFGYWSRHKVPIRIIIQRVCHRRIIFTITDGELQHYRFSGFVKPSGLKQSCLYRWITIILGQEPENEFSTEELIGRDCLVYLSKRKDRYAVIEPCQKDMAPIIASPANTPDYLSV